MSASIATDVGTQRVSCKHVYKHFNIAWIICNQFYNALRWAHQLNVFLRHRPLYWAQPRHHRQFCQRLLYWMRSMYRVNPQNLMCRKPVIDKKNQLRPNINSLPNPSLGISCFYFQFTHNKIDFPLLVCTEEGLNRFVSRIHIWIPSSDHKRCVPVAIELWIVPKLMRLEQRDSKIITMRSEKLEIHQVHAWGNGRFDHI